MAQIDINVALEGFQRANQSLQNLEDRINAINEARKRQEVAERSVQEAQRRLNITQDASSASASSVEIATAALSERTREYGEAVAASRNQVEILAVSLKSSLVDGLARVAAASIDAASKWENFTLAMNSVSVSSDRAAESIDNLVKISRLPGVTLNDALESSVKLQATGASAEEAARMVAELGNALATVGATQGQLQGVMLAITQIQAKGYVYAEEIYQIAERLPQIRQITKDIYGTANTEIIKAEGFTAKEFLRGLTDGLERLPRLKDSLTNSIKNLNNEIFLLFRTVGEDLVKALTTAANLASEFLRAVNSLNPAVLKAVGNLTMLSLVLITVDRTLKTLNQSKSVLAIFEVFQKGAVMGGLTKFSTGLSSSLGKVATAFSLIGSQIAKLLPFVAGFTTLVGGLVAALAVVSIGTVLYIKHKTKLATKLKEVQESTAETTEEFKKYNALLGDTRLAIAQAESIDQLTQSIDKETDARIKRRLEVERELKYQQSSKQVKSLFQRSTDSKGNERLTFNIKSENDLLATQEEIRERNIKNIQKQIKQASEIVEVARKNMNKKSLNPFKIFDEEKTSEKRLVVYQDALKEQHKLMSMLDSYVSTRERTTKLLSINLEKSLNEAEQDIQKFSTFSQDQLTQIENAGSLTKRKQVEENLAAQNALRTSLAQNRKEMISIQKELLKNQFRDLVQILSDESGEFAKLEQEQRLRVSEEMIRQLDKLRTRELSGQDITGERLKLDVGDFLGDQNIDIKINTILDPTTVQNIGPAIAQFKTLANRFETMETQARKYKEEERQRLNEQLYTNEKTKLELKEIEFTLERNKSSLTNTSEAQEYLNTLTERHFEILKLDLEILKATNDNEQERLEVLEKQKISVTEFYTAKLQKMKEEHNLLKSNLELEMKIGMAQSGGGSDSETVQSFISLSQALNKIQTQRDKLLKTSQRQTELENKRISTDKSSAELQEELDKERTKLSRLTVTSERKFETERKNLERLKKEQLSEVSRDTSMSPSSYKSYIEGDSSKKVFTEVSKSLSNLGMQAINYNLLIEENHKFEKQITEELEEQKDKVKNIDLSYQNSLSTLESIGSEIESSVLSQVIQTQELANYHQELKNSTATLNHQADQLEFQLDSIEKMKTSMEALNLSINSGAEAYEKQRKNIELNIKEKQNELAVEKLSIQNAADNLEISIDMNEIQNNIKEITKTITEEEEESNKLGKQNLVAAMERYLANVNLSEELIKQMEISILNLDIERRSTVIREENSRKLAISNKEVEDSLSVQIARQKLLDDTEHNRLRTMELTHRKNIEIQEAQLENIKVNLEEGK